MSDLSTSLPLEVNKDGVFGVVASFFNPLEIQQRGILLSEGQRSGDTPIMRAIELGGQQQVPHQFQERFHTERLPPGECLGKGRPGMAFRPIGFAAKSG